MPDELERRRETIAQSTDLQALRARLRDRAAPLLERMPVIPASKALLSTDGGVCPDDGSALVFDPWSPDEHRCPRCGRNWRGERHDRHWARFQHLWLAERAAHLAALAATETLPAAAARAREILAAYGTTYFSYPNRDNVLGPARLFFSTYLESIWLLDYLAAAVLLRSAGELDADTAELVSVVADEAANLIGDFDEGFSNRQTWHAAALLAIAVWFEDEELAQRAIEGESGLAAHLLHGFGADGMWYEGENYHLFALQGMLRGLAWARAAGVELMADPELAARVHAALRAPCLTALPDRTFPARKDSRFGMSLAQPMYLEIWECGLGALAAAEDEDTSELADWLAGLYAVPAPPAEPFDSYLHEAGEPVPASRARADLSWHALLEMPPVFTGEPAGWAPASALLGSQGLAVLREGERYISLECGPLGGGHGHPDRLHLTLHASGVHWLPDPGTGSYVTPDLFWYRSTLAHNAPRLDGRSQEPGDATCEAFDSGAGWSWVRGRFGELTRTVVSGPGYVVDVVELDGATERLLELPWHVAGSVSVTPAPAWEPADLRDRFVDTPERMSGPGTPVVLRAEQGEARFALHLASVATLLRAIAPGTPGTVAPVTFYLQRVEDRAAALVAVLDTSASGGVRGVRVNGGVIEVETVEGTERHIRAADEWIVERGAERIRLGGRIATPLRFESLTQARPEPVGGTAPFIHASPALDGTLAGFEDAEPLHLDHEDQYRRSEEPYAGPEDFSATARAVWDEEALYLAVDVTKADPVFRSPGVAPLRLDNEPEDIHSDGVQVYVRDADGNLFGALVVPEAGGGLRARRIAGTAASDVHGAWTATDHGYLVTIALRPADWTPVRGTPIGFDLIVNEMHADRERRAGQLVWSGGAGWVWLRGDRQDAARFGELTLQ